jgi:hypothetical protein
MPQASPDTKKLTAFAGHETDGLRLAGILTGRTRRAFDERTRYCYHVQTSRGRILMFTWDSSFSLALGETVDLPIRINTFLTTKGTPSFQVFLDSPGDFEESW